MTRLIFVLGLLSLPINVQAGIITWEVKASITELMSEMTGYANIGDIITLRYDFDDAAFDAEPFVLERGKYETAVTDASILLNSEQAQLQNVGYITILNDFSSGYDAYLTASTSSATISKSLPTHNGFNFSGYSVLYKDNDATMLSDTNLTTEPLISGFDSMRLTLNYSKRISSNIYYGSAIFADDLISIKRITKVPEPSAVWLFLSSITLIFISRFKTIFNVTNN
jgi:hypothetical protein